MCFYNYSSFSHFEESYQFFDQVQCCFLVYYTGNHIIGFDIPKQGLSAERFAFFHQYRGRENVRNEQQSGRIFQAEQRK